MKSFKQDLDEMKQLAEFLEEDLENIRRVIDFCERENLDVEFEIHAKAETCEESVQHSPVEMEQIVKTLVFMAGDQPVAVLAPGNKRVDEGKLKEELGETVRMANPTEVEEATGYVVGGVSPFDLDIPVYIDFSILDNEQVRPAGGSRLVGINIDPQELGEVNNAEIVEV